MELVVGAEELGMADEGFGTGGGQPEGIRDVFQGGGTCGAAFQVVDAGVDPPMGRALGSFQHGVEWRITGIKSRRQEKGGW